MDHRKLLVRKKSGELSFALWECSLLPEHERWYKDSKTSADCYPEVHQLICASGGSKILGNLYLLIEILISGMLLSAYMPPILQKMQSLLKAQSPFSLKVSALTSIIKIYFFFMGRAKRCKDYHTH